jgi:micrococcal nuclease
MTRLALALLFLALAAPAAAETVGGSRIYVVDGDTVRLPGGEVVRLYAIDAPETQPDRARCERELAAGLRAKERLRALLVGQSVAIERCEPSTGRCADRYRRTLGALITPAGDVAMILIAEGHAVPWRAGKDAAQARAAHWCERE